MENLNNKIEGRAEERTCEDCGIKEEIEDMVECPRFVELRKKDPTRGWLHKGCCANRHQKERIRKHFIGQNADQLNQQACTTCSNKDVLEEIWERALFCPDDSDLNVAGLVETSMKAEGWLPKNSEHDFPIFVSEDKIYALSRDAEETFQYFKPLNLVIETFYDHDGKLFFVKDNKKHVFTYLLEWLQEIGNRFPWGLSGSEMFCKDNGLLFIVNYVDSWVFGAILPPSKQFEKDDFSQVCKDICTKLRIKSIEAEKFFGVNISSNREDLKLLVQKLNEVELIRIVLVPILKACGFQGVSPISFHGPGEQGADFHPFYKTNEFAIPVYYSAQAKAIKIHAKSGIKEGNVNQLIDQLKEMYRTSFLNLIENNRKKITQAFVFCSQGITPDAYEQLINAFENRQIFQFIDIEGIIDKIIEKGLSSQIIDDCAKLQAKKKYT